MKRAEKIKALSGLVDGILAGLDLNMAFVFFAGPASDAEEAKRDGVDTEGFFITTDAEGKALSFEASMRIAQMIVKDLHRQHPEESRAYTRQMLDKLLHSTPTSGERH